MVKAPRTKASGLVIAGVPRVNLLPPSVIERRMRAVLTKRWAAGLIASLLAVVAVGGVAYTTLGGAQSLLLDEQSRTVQLTSQLATYSDVTKALADRDGLTSYRADAMANDFAWKPVFDAIDKQLPNGVQMRGFDLTPGANAVSEQDRALAVGLRGSLTLVSADPIDQDKVVDRLRKLEITIDVAAGALEQQAEGGTVYTMLIEFVADQTIYSGQYSKGAGK